MPSGCDPVAGPVTSGGPSAGAPSGRSSCRSYRAIRCVRGGTGGAAMDGRRFDDLTRLLATGTSRRGVLRALGGGGAVLAAVLGRRAEAAPSTCSVGCAGLPG